jgi:hypothetical protein
MSCEVGQQLQKHEDLCREQAHKAFAGSRDSLLGLGHSSAAVEYHRAFDLHVRMGCEACGMENEVREFARG